MAILLDMKTCRKGHDYDSSKSQCPECQRIWKAENIEKVREARRKHMRKWTALNPDLGYDRVAELVDRGVTRAFVPHGLGHSLGVTVHDVGMKLRPPRGATLRCGSSKA